MRNCLSPTSDWFPNNWKRALSRIALISILVLTGTLPALAQTLPLSERMASTAMKALYPNPDRNVSGKPARWTYDFGVVLKGIEGVWYRTGDGRYFNHVRQGLDHFVNGDGTIRTYQMEEYNIDHVLLGRNLLTLYKVTGDDKYRKAAAHLREQLRTHPRTSEGGFWHKKIYPSQMWLDGLYMGEPFYAEYAATFHEDNAFDDIAKQFILMELHSRDAKTGLLYHGWDESKQQRWANPTTGRSPNFWARAMGWYSMGLVDTLDFFPPEHPQRPALLAILKRLATAIEAYQEPKSGLWYDVVDKGTSKGNYLEASAACMFVYALAKGVRQGYLPARYSKVTAKAYQGIMSRFIETQSDGQVNLTGTVSVSGLGGRPYRDGSYEYYMSEKVITNDPKGVGAFLMASNEMEIAKDLAVGKGKMVVLDSYFNSETKKDSTGRVIPWHYKWEEMPNGGFSFLANVFQTHGVATETLSAAPTSANLKRASIYIIVDPDTKAETENPHFVEASHIKAITAWVKAGGVLVLLGNDVGNAEFDHFNQLARQFGIQFNKESRNRVQGDDFAMGRVVTPEGHSIFTTAKRLYLKEIATLALTPPAKPTLEHNGEVIMAISKLGRGTVFALGDPWLYNEYVDGRKLPPDFDNAKAAKDLARWLILQSSMRAR